MLLSLGIQNAFPWMLGFFTLIWQVALIFRFKLKTKESSIKLPTVSRTTPLVEPTNIIQYEFFMGLEHVLFQPHEDMTFFSEGLALTSRLQVL